MNSLEKVKHHIAQKTSEIAKNQGISPMLPGTIPFITISSQSGAGGNQLAEILIEMLSEEASSTEALKDWQLFDKSMCQQLLDEEHLTESMDDLLQEHYHSQINEFVMGIFGDRGMQNVAYARLAKRLRMLASIGKVIILGHGGSLATRNLDGGLHVRLVAPLETRAERMASMVGLDSTAAAQQIRQRDKEQKKVLKTHYHVDSADPEHFHLVCNTDRIPPRTVAELVMSLLKKRLN